MEAHTLLRDLRTGLLGGGSSSSRRKVIQYENMYGSRSSRPIREPIGTELEPIEHGLRLPFSVQNRPVRCIDPNSDPNSEGQWTQTRNGSGLWRGSEVSQSLNFEELGKGCDRSVWVDNSLHAPAYPMYAPSM